MAFTTSDTPPGPLGHLGAGEPRREEHTSHTVAELTPGPSQVHVAVRNAMTSFQDKLAQKCHGLHADVEALYTHHRDASGKVVVQDMSELQVGHPTLPTGIHWAIRYSADFRPAEPAGQQSDHCDEGCERANSNTYMPSVKCSKYQQQKNTK